MSAIFNPTSFPGRSTSRPLFCHGCREWRPKDGAGTALVAGLNVLRCGRCLSQVDAITADEEIELHEALAGVTSFRDAFGGR